MLEPKDLSALIPPEPDLSSLPVDFYPGPTALFGVILMLAGVVGPIVIGGFMALMGLVGDMPDNWGWIGLGFACIPLLALPWGWYVIRSRTIVRIGADQVEYLRVTPLGATRWNAPLAEFSAFAYRKLLPPSRSKSGTTQHGVELCHNTGARDILLVSASDEALARHVQTSMCNLTKLKAEDRDPTRR